MMMERQEELPTSTPRDRLVVAAALAAADMADMAAASDMAADASSEMAADAERELVSLAAD